MPRMQKRKWKIINMEEEKIECELCHRVLKKINFYQTNNLEKYPDGFVHKCKKCLTMTVDNWKPSTFLHILQEIDVPYIPKEWDSLLAKYGSDPRKVTGTTILGRYLSKMKLRQNEKYRFKDTEKFVTNDAKQRQAFMQQLQSSNLGLQPIESLEIDENIEEQEEDDFDWNLLDEMNKQNDNNVEVQYAETPVGLNSENTLNYEDELSLEEKKYLVFKWGKGYSWEDMIKMETLYQETAESFDVSNPNHKDYLKKICKASLQLDRVLDYGDADSAAKYGRMYDMLNKSAKFTAASNKIEKEEYIGSVGELVAICEKEGFIPRYHNEENKDIVDKTLEDMNNYIKKLISNEMNLADLIEASIKMIAIEEAKAKAEENEELTEEELLAEDYDYIDESIYEDEIENIEE